MVGTAQNMISRPVNYRRSLRSATCRREGYGRRRYKAEYVRFLIFAHASCDETIEWLQYIIDLYPEYSTLAQEACDQANQVGARLNRFIQAVEAKHNDFESSAK